MLVSFSLLLALLNVLISGFWSIDFMSTMKYFWSLVHGVVLRRMTWLRSIVQSLDDRCSIFVLTAIQSLIYSKVILTDHETRRSLMSVNKPRPRPNTSGCGAGNHNFGGILVRRPRPRHRKARPSTCVCAAAPQATSREAHSTSSGAVGWLSE